MRFPFRFQPGPARALRAALAGLLALSVLCAAPPAAAAAGQERMVKAAFLLKFVGYVEFPAPAAPDAPLVIGVVGAPRVAAELARLAAHSAGNRTVVVRELGADEALAGIDMLFIGGRESEHAARLLHLAARQGILAVTEFDDGLREGSVINFRLVDERVRFEVSLTAADKAHLKLSSRLLSVAYLVEKPRD
jgi:hypothetical protein